MNELIVTMTKDDLENLFIGCMKSVLKQHSPPTAAAPSTPNEPPFLSAKDAAKLLNIHPNSIFNTAREGKLTRHYIGKSVRFARAEVLGLAKTHSSTNKNYRNA